MKKNTFLKFLLGVSTILSGGLYAQQSYTTNIFNHVVFYDGYAATVSNPTQADVVRIANDKYAKRLTDAQLDGLLKTLKVEVKLGALCDNYDRIGGVFVSLVPKGEEITSSNKQLIEIGRFITPFMNKNKQPTEVPYSFDLKHLLGLFKSSDIRTEYDIWMELHVFGVPYAANTQVAGCANRNDVFEGTLDLVSSSDGYDTGEFFIKPLAAMMNFNNYNATDVAGTTTRIITFTLDTPISEAGLHLITSNHGANENGEEYVRRQHYVYFDDNQVLTYKPGGKSCEPYRQYNTQGNGIYGSSVKSESWWTSWNNWCPGDVIPNRVIQLGDLEAGQHTFKIEVPSAVFSEGEGNFPLSLFLFSEDIQGTVSVHDVSFVDYSLYPNPAREQVTVTSSENLEQAVLYDMSGKEVLRTTANAINIGALAAGTYVAKLKFQNGGEATEKIIKK